MGPWLALHALIKSRGSFAEDDQFADVFSPHISKRDGLEVQTGQHIAFPTVALFKRNTDSTRTVESAYALKPAKESND